GMVAVEFEVYTRTGDKRVWAFSASCPGRLQDGRRFAVGMAVDITDRKEAEQALKQADKRKDEFLATLAHELRNPLAPIRNALSILRMDAPASDAAAQVHEMMERQLNYLVRLVDDLFEVSRITRGNIELRLERAELGALIRSAVETSRPLIDAAQHSLTVELPPGPMPVEADPVRLVQVFANLLNNAAKYTPDGGRIRVTARADDSHVIVAVQDNGNGIAPEMQPRVFDMFTQLESPALYKRGGLGLGLAIVRGLVRMHGGTVDVRSDGPGKGSEFLVCLPLAAAQAAPQPVAVPAEPAGDKGQRIMIVDDNVDAADSLGILLRMHGAHVHVAHAAQDALDVLAGFDPDVIFMDLGMPGMDGFEAARRIRANPRFARVALIALSGWGAENDRRRSRAAGFDHHLIKPADFTALQNLLASLPRRGEDKGKVVQLFG
ncbi:MAG TPA: ATP-binding protein, partial [Nevskiaceae bacterium]|nr:ATP-binding protein [Nevskiaceae bacterium]